MSATLFDTIRRIVREEMASLPTAELGIVEQLHPHAAASDRDNYACTVRLRDSGLVLSRVPVATPRIGSVAIPAEGELVLVQFLGGSLNAPVITGRLYNEEDRPPVSDDGVAVLHLPLAAGDDEAVHAELKSGDERSLTFQLGKGLKVTLRDDDPAVEIEIDGGKAKLAIAIDGSVTLETKGDVALDGKGKLELKANEISIEAQGGLKLKGATIDLN